MKKITINSNAIASGIYLTRGKKVMLDRDLAMLYGVSVKSARKRHPIPIEPDTPFRFKATGHSDRKRHLF